MLPFTVACPTLWLLYTPTSNISVLPRLCNAADRISVVARNSMLAPQFANSTSLNLTFQLDCTLVVCDAGQERLVAASANAVCVPCKATTYNPYINASCETCPDGAICAGGASISSVRGYWQLENEFYRCSDSDRCCPMVRSVSSGRAW